MCVFVLVIAAGSLAMNMNPSNRRRKLYFSQTIFYFEAGPNDRMTNADAGSVLDVHWHLRCMDLPADGLLSGNQQARQHAAAAL
jgi:hypothetical protein